MPHEYFYVYIQYRARLLLKQIKFVEIIKFLTTVYLNNFIDGYTKIFDDKRIDTFRHP